MKITINEVSDLRPVLMALKKGRSRSSMTVLKSVRIVGEESGRIHLTYYDLDVARSYDVDGTVEVPGVFAPDLVDFEKAVKTLFRLKGSLSIATDPVEKDEAWASFTHERLDFRIKGAALPEELPALPAIEGDDVVVREIPAADLLDALESCLISVSRDDSRVNLTGVYLNGDTAVSTDGPRMRIRTIPGLDLPEGEIVPLQAVEALVDGLKRLKPGTVEITCSSSEGSRPLFCFDFDGGSIATITIDGTFPDFRSVLPARDRQREVVASSKAVQEAIALVTPFSSTKTNSIRLSFGEGVLELYASEPGMGEGTSSLPIRKVSEDALASVEFPAVKMAINRAYLLAALKDLDSDEVIMAPVDTLSPLILRSPGAGDDDFWIVMPMRL